MNSKCLCFSEGGTSDFSNDIKRNHDKIQEMENQMKKDMQLLTKKISGTNDFSNEIKTNNDKIAILSVELWMSMKVNCVKLVDMAILSQ